MADARILALYGEAPGDFVKGRDLLARALKGEGKAAESAAVAKLRRPAAAAWAIDQVARAEPKLLQALLAADEELRKAQARANTPAGLRAAMQAQRDAVREVTRAAESKLPASARAAQSRAIHSTVLAAAAGGDELRARLLEGSLDEALEAPGFDALAGMAIAAPAAPVAAELAKTHETREAHKAHEPQKAPEQHKPLSVAERAAGRSQRQDQRKLKAAREAARRESRAFEREATKLETKAALAEREAAQATHAAEKAKAAAEKSAERAKAASEAAAETARAAAEARKKADEAKAKIPPA